MNKQIILSIDKKKELASTFGFSRQTVWAALLFRTKSKKARMLQKAALERGGILIGGTKCNNKITPDLMTEFITAENLMVQTFTDRVKVIVDLSTGIADIYADGEVVDSHPELFTDNWLPFHRKVQSIADQLK